MLSASSFRAPQRVGLALVLTLGVTSLSSVASAKMVDEETTSTNSDVQESAQAHPAIAGAGNDSEGENEAAPAPASASSSFDARWNASVDGPIAPIGSDAPVNQEPKGDPFAHKRAVVARDFGIAVPVGAFADRAAPMYGPLVRLGYHVTESFEVGLRAGYQRGLDRDIDGSTQSLSAVPINVSVRYFVLGDRSGPYAGFEAGVNVFRQRERARTSFWDVGADATWVRPCANVGVGWVYSKKFPVDLRVQVASLDLLSAGKGPVSSVAVGGTLGYSIFF